MGIAQNRPVTRRGIKEITMQSITKTIEAPEECRAEYLEYLDYIDQFAVTLYTKAVYLRRRYPELRMGRVKVRNILNYWNERKKAS